MVSKNSLPLLDCAEGEGLHGCTEAERRRTSEHYGAIPPVDLRDETDLLYSGQDVSFVFCFVITKEVEVTAS
jgi:hypothetical protein